VIPDSVTSIGNYAFSGCSNLSKLYYMGDEIEWSMIKIKSRNRNDKIELSIIRYYYSETEPTAEGNYWNYDENGNVVEW
jgi:hypothetical protein